MHLFNNNLNGKMQIRRSIDESRGNISSDNHKNLKQILNPKEKTRSWSLNKFPQSICLYTCLTWSSTNKQATGQHPELSLSDLVLGV